MSLIHQTKKNKKKTITQIQSKHRGKQPNQIEKPKKVSKGITKSIKM